MWDVIGDSANRVGELCTAVAGNDAVWLVIAQVGALYGIVMSISVREWLRRRRDTRQTVAVVAGQRPQQD